MALPRCAIGALPFAVSMKVAKFVMSSATDEQSSPNAPTARCAIAPLACSSCSSVTECIASQNRRWSRTVPGTPVNRGAAVLAHQSANPSFEHGATTRFSAASARYVPADAPASARRGPAASSISAATPRSSSTPHAAATAPKSLCWVRSGSPRPPPRIAAASSSAVPRYSCETIRGLPSTRADSTR